MAEYDVCFAGDNTNADGLNESATRALAENPRNSSLTIHTADDFSSIEPPTSGTNHLVMYVGKFWKPGRRLKISFQSGTTWQKGKVKQYAPIWCQYANLSMHFVDKGPCDILISFKPNDGSWSVYGTDSSFYANQGMASMNLGWINDNRGEDELRSVILHEFGHALGAIHEHQSPFGMIRWNKPQVYKDLGGPPNNWNHDKIDANMFAKYSQNEVKATTFDRNSIMIYYYPPQWTLDYQGTPFNSNLSEADKSYIRFIYPPISLDAGQFNTMELRPRTQPGLKNSTTKYFSQEYSHAPRVLFGLTSLDIAKDHNIRIIAHATHIKPDRFTASLNAWSDTILYSASLTYLEAGPGFGYLQTGTFSTKEVGHHEPKNSKRIHFNHSFRGHAPKVICWLNSADLDHRYNWRCKTYATDIDTHGFTVHIDTWLDTIMYSAGMTWLAYPADQPNVTSGYFKTHRRLQQENTATEKFSRSFNHVPKIAMALSSFDFNMSQDLHLRLSTSDVSPTGMRWHLRTWSGSMMYSSSASYFAWA